MQYRKYGSNGPGVSTLGFGAMRLPLQKADDSDEVDFTESVAIMRQAMDAGLNFFDSHHMYHGGLSEVAIGKAIADWKGRRIYIQTKTPMYRGETLATYKRYVQEALEKCGVETIDYLLSHSLTMSEYKKQNRKFLKLTDWAIEKGYIRHRGFSSHDTPENVKTYVDTGHYAVMLLSYNLLNPMMQDTIAYGADNGMGVAIMNSVGGGTLGETTPQVLRLLPGAKSSPEVALRYVLATPGVSVALSGMSSREQVEENTRIAGRKSYMTEKQWDVMGERLKKMQIQTMAICTACGYCMPCPNGVDIPRNFLLLNQTRLLGLVEASKARFKRMQEKSDVDKSACACKQCGKCLPKCPNDIPIIEQLMETARLLG